MKIAVHMASALLLFEHLEGEDLEVGCWDSKLWFACRQAGLKMFPTDQPGKKGPDSEFKT
jgi:hypothetical protein